MAPRSFMGSHRTSYDCEERRLGVPPPPLSQVVDLVDLGLLAEQPAVNGVLECALVSSTSLIAKGSELGDPRRARDERRHSH